MTQHELAFKAAGILILAFEKRGDINGTFDPAWMCGPIENAIAAAVAEAVKAEREACAQAAESTEHNGTHDQFVMTRNCAAAIRARNGAK